MGDLFWISAFSMYSKKSQSILSGRYSTYRLFRVYRPPLGREFYVEIQVRMQKPLPLEHTVGRIPANQEDLAGRTGHRHLRVNGIRDRQPG